MATRTRGLRLIERHARLYRRMWLIVVAGAAEPLFYMLSVGVGIGGVIGTVTGPNGQVVPYREFVAPGLLAVSALNGALGDSTFNVFGRLKLEKLTTRCSPPRSARGTWRSPRSAGRCCAA